jgi:hypothetical protein
MYDPDKPFVERIELAIQRFKQKKKMHEVYANIFNKWMRFGGVESTPRMFGGLSSQDMAGMDAGEIARARAVHNVPWDREDPKQWEVDFTGVGAAFLYVVTLRSLTLDNDIDRLTGLPISLLTMASIPNRSRPPVRSCDPSTTTSSTTLSVLNFVQISTAPANYATPPRPSSPKSTTRVLSYPVLSTRPPALYSVAPKPAPTRVI